jgi:hypothetical protein
MPIYLGDKLISKEYVDSYESGLLYLGSNIIQGNVDYKVSDLGLVAYYDISNPNCYASGSTTVYDLTANNNDMTFNDGVISYKPINSGILELNNGYAVGTTTTNLPSGSGVTQPSFTYGFWTKYSQFGTQANVNNAFGFGSQVNGEPGYMALTNVSSSTDLYFGSTGDAGYSMKAVSTFNTSSWYNIMVSYSGSNDVNASPGIASVYVNGQFVNSGSMNIIVSGQGVPISLGVPNGFNANNRGFGFYGSFAVGYVYNRLMNANEIAFNWNAQKNRFGQ